MDTEPDVLTVRSGPVIGLIAQLALLAVLARTLGLTAAGWLVGLGCGLLTCAALSAGLNRAGTATLGPADRVTLGRTTLVGGVAALVTDGYLGRPAVPALVALATAALLLDLV